MSFKFKLEKSKVLRSIVESLSSVVDETIISVSPEGLLIMAMDPSRICLLQLELKKEDFEEFECEKESKVGINLEDLDKILKRSSVIDSLSISFEPKSRKFKIKMKQEGSLKVRTFSLGEIELEQEDIPMENLLQIAYDAEFVINPTFFIEAIKDAEIYSEIITIKADDNKGLDFSSIGQIGEMEYELGVDELDENNIKGVSTGSYSLNFLKNILKVENVAEKLAISLKDDHPVKLVFNILEGGILNYFLAPRVSEVDEAIMDEEVETEEY